MIMMMMMMTIIIVIITVTESRYVQGHWKHAQSKLKTTVQYPKETVMRLFFDRWEYYIVESHTEVEN